MNLWAVRIMRKSHSKEILRAKIVDVDTMRIVEFGEDLLYGAIVHGGMHIHNLDVKNGKVILVGYDKTLKENNAKMYMNRVRRQDWLIESFIIVLRGYKAVYEFLADNPVYDDRAIHMVGTVSDLDELLDESGITWDGHGVYNGIVTADTWANEKSGRYKILKYTEDSPSKHDWFCNIEMKGVADLRLAIDCDYCQLRLINGTPVIVNVKFNNEEVTIPDGIFAFNKSFGGAYMITFPETLLKLGIKCFKLDNDILQVNFRAPIQSIPKAFAASSNLQIFDYPSNFSLESIEEYAFSDCCDLRSDLVCQVKYIKRCAFQNTAIKKAIIPYCTEVGHGAFGDCYKLETVKLGDGAIIGDFAFNGCCKLTNIDLSKAQSIGRGAFDGCRKLRDVVLKRGTIVGENAFHPNTVIHWI